MFPKEMIWFKTAQTRAPNIFLIKNNFKQHFLELLLVVAWISFQEEFCTARLSFAFSRIAKPGNAGNAGTTTPGPTTGLDNELRHRVSVTSNGSLKTRRPESHHRGASEPPPTFLRRTHDDQERRAGGSYWLLVLPARERVSLQGAVSSPTPSGPRLTQRAPQLGKLPERPP